VSRKHVFTRWLTTWRCEQCLMPSADYLMFEFIIRDEHEHHTVLCSGSEQAT
jgi:hypothetical protein